MGCSLRRPLNLTAYRHWIILFRLVLIPTLALVAFPGPGAPVPKEDELDAPRILFQWRSRETAVPEEVSLKGFFPPGRALTISRKPLNGPSGPSGPESDGIVLFGLEMMETGPEATSGLPMPGAMFSSNSKPVKLPLDNLGEFCRISWA